MKEFHKQLNPVVCALLAAMVMLLLLSSCHRNDDQFVGRWIVERVNVAFDEHVATPEMVRQYGEMEKGNIIEISKDSVLMFISDGDTVKGRCSLKGSNLFLEGKSFGQYENGMIQTESSTALGIVKVIYRK